MKHEKYDWRAMASVPHHHSYGTEVVHHQPCGDVSEPDTVKGSVDLSKDLIGWEFKTRGGANVKLERIEPDIHGRNYRFSDGRYRYADGLWLMGRWDITEHDIINVVAPF